MRLLAQFIGLLLLIGIVGAYFWPIGLTLAAAFCHSGSCCTR